MRQFIKPRETVALIVLLLAFSCSDAHAYIDPGTGSYALQIVLAVVLGGMFFIKTFFKRIAAFFQKLFSRKDQ